LLVGCGYLGVGDTGVSETVSTDLETGTTARKRHISIILIGARIVRGGKAFLSGSNGACWREAILTKVVKAITAYVPELVVHIACSIH
jgi:hypothetical protein